MTSPQEARHNKTPVKGWISAMILALLFASGTSILLSSVHLFPSDKNLTRQRVPLDGSWEYATETAHRAPGMLPSPPQEGWSAYDPKNSWKFSEDFQRSTWLRKTFEAQFGFESPALVLGRIPGNHRVYLNGQLIGGSDIPEALAFYPFEGNLLRTDSSNMLWVSVRSRPTLEPGITEFKDLGMFIGDFQDVRQSSMSAQTRLYIHRSLLLALSLTASFVALGFAITRPTQKQYFYASLFLLSSAMQIAQIHPWVAGALDISRLRLLQTVALALGPFALFSGCLHLQRKHFAETLNNGAALITIAALSIYFLDASESATRSGSGVGTLSSEFHQVAIATLIYTLAWISMTALERLFSRRRQPKIRESRVNLFDSLFVFFGLVSAIGAYMHADSASLNHPWAHDGAEISVQWLPFLFAVVMAAAAAWDRYLNQKASATQFTRDETVLELIRLTHDASDISDKVAALQARVSAFLKVHRSTLYVLEENSAGQTILKSNYASDDSAFRTEFLQVNWPEQSLDHALIDWVQAHRSPILINHWRKDSRFSRFDAPDQPSRNCMAFPLIRGGSNLGALIFFDKRSGHVFTQEDFAIALEVSNDISILLDSRQLLDSLKKRSATSS
jgi:hypothetical protein